MKQTKKDTNKPTGQAPAAATRADSGRVPHLLATGAAAASIILFTVLVALSLLCGSDSWTEGTGMPGGYANYLRKIAELSIFIPGYDYLAECMRTPGGIVVWLSTLATTSMSTSGGAWIFALLCGLMTVLVVRTFRLPSTAAMAAVVPAAAATVILVNFGYFIFSAKSPGFAFVPPVGCIIALVYCRLYRLLPWWWLRCIVTLLWVFLTYPAFGFFALLGAALTSLTDIVSAVTKRRLLMLAAAVAAILAIWLYPPYYFEHTANDINAAACYLSPLPAFHEGEKGLWRPYMVMVLSLGVYALLQGVVTLLRRVPRITAAVSLCVGIGASVWMCTDRADDPNLRLTLDMDRAIHDYDYDTALRMLGAFGYEPTRLNILYGQTALFRIGRAPQDFWRLPYGQAPYLTDDARALRVIHEVGAPMMLYNMGLGRYGYRMAMENLVEYGITVESLKYLARNALLNGDYDVARKYLRTLASVPNRKDWAAKYLEYADNPKLIADDPVMGALQRLNVTDNRFIADNGRFEGYLWPYLAERPTDNNDQLEQAMIGALMDQQLDTFIGYVDRYLTDHKTLPRHFQEGVLAWALATKSDYSQYPIDKEIEARYKDFVKLLNGSSRSSEDELFRAVYSSYGDTYWFYYMYKPHLNIL